MKRTTVYLLVAMTGALYGCSNDSKEAENTDLTIAATGEAEALAKALPAGDYSQLALGAKIIGAAGREDKDALSNRVGNFADIRSYVSCPEGMDPCDPNSAPEGTIFTYIHVVIPGEDNDRSTGSGEGPDSSTVESATAFSMTRPALGFTGNAGYAKSEALAAMGKSVDVIITCDEGKIIWTVNSGDGGNQWQSKEPVTFYWQSTLPPAGAAKAYRIHADHTIADGTGPYPAMSEAATNACELKDAGKRGT